MNILLENKIEAWLKKMDIKNYVLHKNDQYGFTVDVMGTVDLKNKDLIDIPVQFNSVTGSFNCSKNSLKSLKGCPKFVEENFDCSDNLLKDLQFSPEKVGRDFQCNRNFTMTSLWGAPIEIGKNFFCSSNQLKSLEHCPRKIGGCFGVHGIYLESLEFFPEYVGKIFGLIGEAGHFVNPELAHIDGFEDGLKLHLKYVRIKQEKRDLEKFLGKSQQINHQKHKI